MTNLAFTALIKSKGYNKQRLADVCGLSKTQMSNRINGANDWRWPEVGKACAALGITLDEFATYYPVADVRKSSAAMPTRAERIDSVLAELREILMPLAMQIYNHYRKHWLAAYWQQCGIHVVPTLCWSNKQSYEWCFDGEPQHSIVAISSVGTQKSKQNQALFEKGVRAALARLEPSEILWYGKCPEEFDWNVTRIQPYYKRVRRRCENGR